MTKGRLDINLLGTSFAIQANESEDYLDSIYMYYKDIVKQVENTVGNSYDPLKIAIMAGILITDELKKEKINFSHISTGDNENIALELSTKKLIDKLNNAIDYEDMD